MPERYLEAIIKYLSSRQGQPLKPRQLARQMGLGDAEYGTFREAVKRLAEQGRVVMGSGNALTLPAMAEKVVGIYRANPKGFGFVIPEEPNAHGDLFIPSGAQGSAVTGDLVQARAKKRGKRDGRRLFVGEILRIIERAKNRFVGQLVQSDDTWFVLPDGRAFTSPILIRDVGPARADTKVVVEIVKYGRAGDLSTGAIVETLGPVGSLEIETLAAIRAHGLAEEFPADVLDEARRVVGSFDPDKIDGREDLTELTVVTIDPADARDYDDAISICNEPDGTITLGVHIADVAHFVTEGTALNAEARKRATSVYFPRKVLPMLPEVLSNGVCSLQEGQRRLCKSVFINYDGSAKPVGYRLTEGVICSAKRLTYKQAQRICDGKTGGYAGNVVQTVKLMEALARKVERRRVKAGMLELDLPEVSLVFDKAGNVTDAHPTDDSYTHKIIEMFMVEANEAVAGLLDRAKQNFLRRIHPAPAPDGAKDMAKFVRAAGHKLPSDLTRFDMQQLLAAVRGKPESYAVNLAMLKTFQAAEYSPMQVGHYALASEKYCHFTSPIRRYPDLHIHRLVAMYCRGLLAGEPVEDVAELVKLGQDCTAAERKSEAAERELREVMILQLLVTKIGTGFDGVVTGVTNFGIFVQSSRWLLEGLIRMEDLGDDWWDVQARYGTVRGERSGKVFRIGDMLAVRIAGVDLPRRQLNLTLGRELKAKAKKSLEKPRKRSKSKQ